MIEWDGFKYFLALSRRGTLRSAAQELGVDQATVGRRISALEEALGTQFFEKRSDGYFLTLAGERILPTLQATEEGLLSVERIIAGRDEKVEGLVRLAMPGALANHWLIPRLRPLLEKYPKLELEFLTGPEVVNLARREADIAIRLVRPTQRDLVARKVGELELALYGHPSLFASLRKPVKKEDLKAFPFVGLAPDAVSDLERTILKRIEGHIRCTIRSAAWSSVFYTVQAGLGVGILPSVVAERDPKLIRLQVVEPSRASLWMVIHPDIVQSARVRALIDYLGSLFWLYPKFPTAV